MLILLPLRILKIKTAVKLTDQCSASSAGDPESTRRPIKDRHLVVFMILIPDTNHFSSHPFFKHQMMIRGDMTDPKSFDPKPEDI